MRRTWEVRQIRRLTPGILALAGGCFLQGLQFVGGEETSLEEKMKGSVLSTWVGGALTYSDGDVQEGVTKMMQNEIKGKKGQGQSPGSSHYFLVWQKSEEQPKRNQGRRVQLCSPLSFAGLAFWLLLMESYFSLGVFPQQASLSLGEPTHLECWRWV